MFSPIETEAHLPALGSARETHDLDLKAHGNPEAQFEMAKDVAAFANGVGGTLLVGGAEADGKLSKYIPMVNDEADTLANAYSRAIQSRCRPRPLANPKILKMDSGFVLAVNVWPFPGQAVGVRVKGDKTDGFGDATFVFPLRCARDTVFITPEQLPMLMLPDLRQTWILLDKAANEDAILEIRTHEAPRKCKLVELRPLENQAVLRNLDAETGAQEWALPISAIRAVWRGSRGDQAPVMWCVALTENWALQFRKELGIRR